MYSFIRVVSNSHFNLRSAIIYHYILTIIVVVSSFSICYTHETPFSLTVIILYRCIDGRCRYNVRNVIYLYSKLIVVNLIFFFPFKSTRLFKIIKIRKYWGHKQCYHYELVSSQYYYA